MAPKTLDDETTQTNGATNREHIAPLAAQRLGFWAFTSRPGLNPWLGNWDSTNYMAKKKSSDVQNFLISTKSIWTSLVAQPVKSLPEVQESQVRSLGWEDPLEKGMATHSSILAWRRQGQRAWRVGPWGHQELDRTERLTQHDSIPLGFRDRENVFGHNSICEGKTPPWAKGWGFVFTFRFYISHH